MVGCSEQDVVEHGQTSQRTRYLKRADEPTLRDPIGRCTVDATLLELDRSPLSREKARDHIEERRLASPIGADQCGDRAALDVKRSTVDCAEPAERTHDVSDYENRHGHSSTISFRLPKMPCGRKSIKPMITSPITISRT